MPTASRIDVVTSTVGVNQKLPWFRTYVVFSWDASHTDGDDFLNSYNPLLRSGLSLDVSPSRSCAMARAISSAAPADTEPPRPQPGRRAASREPRAHDFGG